MPIPSPSPCLPAAWQALAAVPRQLRVDAALTLAARQGGWLQVVDGRAWLTRQGDADDHVLAPGEQLWLAPGQSVVVEPWRARQPVRLQWAQGRPAEPPQPLLLRLPVARPATLGWSGAVGLGLARVAAVLALGLADLLVGAAAGLRRAAGWVEAARNAAPNALRAQGAISAGESMASSGACQ